MRTDAVSETPTPTTSDGMTRDKQICNDIEDHLPIEPHKALARSQIRMMLRGLGYTGKNEVRNEALRGYLLALNRETRINRTDDGKYHGIERHERRVPAKSAEPMRHRKHVLDPWRTEDGAVL